MKRTNLLWRFPSVLMAWRNLGRNRIRTGLAALGIIIGVVAIASLGMATAAIQQQATENLQNLANEVTVSAGEDSDTDGLTEEQIDEIQGLVGDASVVPQKSNSTVISARSGRETRVRVTALSEPSVLYNVSVGESPDRLQSGALLTAGTAEDLGIELGDPVAYDGQLFRVIGLIEADDGFGPSAEELVLPLSALSSQQYYDSVTIVADDGEEATAIADRLDSAFNQQGRGDSEDILSIQSFASVQEQIGSFLNTLSLSLLGIGGISLVVASVAILNVMLMSTVERRGEIGVLRAVGIRRMEVLRMILAEAAFLGVAGGVIGAVISLLIGFVLFHYVSGNFLLVFGWDSSRYLVMGFLFAVGASLLSGIYPAWKAANDPPVESLRS